jgi:hypothetical protein
MNCKALKETLRLVTKLSNNPSVGPGQRDQLQKVKRELEKIAHSGKLDPDRIFRCAETVATVLLDHVEHDVVRKPE